jgi:hypothetical protein
LPLSGERSAGTSLASACPAFVSPHAHLTILWGTTPIGLAHLTPGRSITVEDGVFVARASPRARKALIVRMDARGVTVTRSPAPRAAPDPLRLPIGAEVEIPLAGTAGGLVYRRAVAWEREPIALRVAVTTEPPRPSRPRIAARFLAAVAFAAAAHVVPLAISAAAMPPLAELDLELSDDQSWSYPVMIPVDPRAEDTNDDPGGDAPEVCTADRPFGRSIAVQGPIDNPDPHIARDQAIFDELAMDVIGFPRAAWGGDEHAPTAPWGRDDSLGTDGFSATGTARGEFDRDLFATCFGPRSSQSICGDEYDPPARATLASLGLEGIGDESAPPVDPRPIHRPARVVVGPIAVTANVPRWLVVSTVHDAVDRARRCYERALADTPALAGRLDAVLEVRGEDTSFAIDPKGDADMAPLRCCLEQAHVCRWTDLPTGTRATARYSITFGRPAE